MHLKITQLHLSAYKPHTTHNSLIRSDEGLTLEIALRWPIHITNPVDKTNDYLVIKQSPTSTPERLNHDCRRKIILPLEAVFTINRTYSLDLDCHDGRTRISPRYCIILS